MTKYSNLIDKLIPERFKITYEQSTKARGFVITQSIIGIILILTGLFLGIVEFYSNTFIGTYIVLIIFALRLFKNLENYVNITLLGGYIGLFFIYRFKWRALRR